MYYVLYTNHVIDIQIEDLFIDGNPSSKRKLNNNQSDVTNLQDKGKQLESQLFGIGEKNMILLIY